MTRPNVIDSQQRSNALAVQGDQIMTRDSMQDAATFTAIVTAAFVVRNAIVIGGIASFLVFGLFSA
jgi:hypothetical protein